MAGFGKGFEWADFIIVLLIVGIIIVVLVAFAWLFLGSIIPAIPLTSIYGVNTASILANTVGAFGGAISLFISPLFIIAFAVALLLIIGVAIVYLLRLRSGIGGGGGYRRD